MFRTTLACTSIWTTLFAALPVVLPPTAQAQTAPDKSLAAVLAEALKVDSVDLIWLDFDRRPGQPLRLAVPIGGVERVLEMTPVSHRSPRFNVRVQLGDLSYCTVTPPTPCTLRGRVDGIETSIVAGGVLDDGLYATVQLPGEGDVQWWIQPASSAVKPDMAAMLPDGLHVLYSGPYRGTAVCTTDDHHVDTGASLDGGAEPVIVDRGGTKRIAELSVDAEYAFFQKTGSVLRSVSMIELLINLVNVQFERDVDIGYNFTTIIIRTTQIYVIGGPNLTQQFRNQWNANHTDIPRDVALFLDGNGEGGQTFLNGQVCNISNAYSGAGVDPPTLHYRTDVISHELGHNWNACHCPCVNPGYTMNWQITGTNRFTGSPFSDCGLPTVAEIVNFRNSRSCLGTFAGPLLPNDACARAIDVPCAHQGDIFADCAFGFDNSGATQDGPSDGCRPGNADIWYRFVPRCTGQVRVHTCNHATFDTVLMAYDGSSGCPTSSATLVACNDDNPNCSAGGLRSEIIFTGQAGRPYLIRVAGFNLQTGNGILEFRFTNCPMPPNDRCMNPTTVAARDGVPFSTLGAVTGTWVQPTFGVPRDSWLENCGGFDDLQLVNDVWFRYVAACSGPTLFSLCGSGFDTKMALYQTSCPNGDFQALICNDDDGPACAGDASSFLYSVVAGQTYLIRVGGYAGAAGDGFLTITPSNCPAPSNNNCTNPTVLQAMGMPVTIPAEAFNAGRDGAATCNGSVVPDVWFSFTAPCDGTFHANTCGTFAAAGRRTSLSIHSGCPGTPVNQLACNLVDPGCGGNDSAASTAMTLGQAVLLRIAMLSAFPAESTVSLTYRFDGPAPTNDSCVTPGTASQQVRSFCLAGATPSPEGQTVCPSVGPDIWFGYTSTCNGMVRASVCNTTFPVQVAVFSDCAGSLLRCVTGGAQVCGSTSLATFTAVNGVSYRIRVSGVGGAVGRGDISVIGCPPSSLGVCCTASGCLVTAPNGCRLLEGEFMGRDTVCPPPPVGGGNPMCCPPDINGTGTLTVQDIFDFLVLYFSGDLRGDFNRNESITVQDIFDFLAAYFAGC